MTGGGLTTRVAYVGYAGTGTFTQTDGNHCVRQTLSIATQGDSNGTYDLQGGNLFADELVVGGSSTAKGGTATFTISGGRAVVDGEVTIWSEGTAHLGGGSLVGPDSNHPYVDVDNSGMLYVDSGVCCLGRVAGIGDTMTGTIVVAGGATLWAASIEQDSLIVQPGGTVHLAAENYDLFMSLARENQSQVPEPAPLALLGLGGLAVVRRSRRRLRQASGTEACSYLLSTRR
jgi:MYXO-CTERM domain-containing protein